MGDRVLDFGWYTVRENSAGKLIIEVTDKLDEDEDDNG